MKLDTVISSMTWTRFPGMLGHFSKSIIEADFVTHSSQNPQCEGANQKRYLFNSRASTHNRTAFKVTLEHGQFILDAGVVAGITEGAEFVVYASMDGLFTDPLGALVIEKLGPFSTILKVPPGGSNFVLSQPRAVALQTKMDQRFNLRLYVPDSDASRLCREALLSLMDRERDLDSIYLVDKSDAADFGLAMENEKVIFLFRDQRVTQHGHTRLFEGVEPTPEELAHVLKAAAYFYWKLNRTNNNNPIINSGVQVELYKLLPPTIRRFDEDVDGLKPMGPNLYDTVMEVVADEDIPYGLKLTNNTAYDLYPNLFYFDLSDLSIGECDLSLSMRRLFNFNTSVAYYEASSTAWKYTLEVPLPKNGGVLTIGYGSGGAPAQTFNLRPDQNFGIGFLKIFLSTEPIDLSSIPQSTPFEQTRSGDRLAKNKEEAWGTMPTPVLQRLSDSASLEVTQQPLRIQGLQAENIALKCEIDVLLSSIPQLTLFDKTRSGDRLAKKKEKAWGTMLIPVLQRLSDPGSLEVIQQPLKIQGFQADNIALNPEIDVLYEIEAQRRDEAQRDEVQRQEAQRQAEALLVFKTELQQEKAECQRLDTLPQG